MCADTKLTEQRDGFLKQREELVKEANELLQKADVIKTNIIRLEGVIGYLNQELSKPAVVTEVVK